MSTETTHAPGRLGDPDMTIGTDPRADPRMVEVFKAFGMDGRADDAPFGADTPLEELLAFLTAAEEQFEGLFAALADGSPPIEGVTNETINIDGPDGNQIPLYISKPANAEGPLPVICQTHGGGMVMLSTAGPLYQRWRDELAAAGAIAVGVEFRNGGGSLGPHAFPAGINDCAAALKWIKANHDSLGGNGKTIVTGDSGGANLACALAIKAKKEGFADAVDGVYAQCPYVLGDWTSAPPELPSLTEVDGYFLNRTLFPVLAEVYDPGRSNAKDPTAWPSNATTDDLTGLPPHIISVNQVDPLRDEGLAYHRALQAAGVSSVSKTNSGLCHVGEIMFRAQMPDVYLNAVRDVVGFARSV